MAEASEVPVPRQQGPLLGQRAAGLCPREAQGQGLAAPCREEARGPQGAQQLGGGQGCCSDRGLSWGQAGEREEGALGRERVQGHRSGGQGCTSQPGADPERPSSSLGRVTSTFAGTGGS